MYTGVRKYFILKTIYIELHPILFTEKYIQLDVYKQEIINQDWFQQYL